MNLHKSIGIFCLALLLFGCSKPETMLNGQWETSNGGITIEFFDNGKATVRLGGFAVSATYEIVDSDKSSCVFRMNAGSELFIQGVLVKNDPQEFRMAAEIAGSVLAMRRIS